jgi:hypothetical protein
VKFLQILRKASKPGRNAVAGAMEKREYLDTIEKAGFKEIEIREHIISPNLTG